MPSNVYFILNCPIINVIVKMLRQTFVNFYPYELHYHETKKKTFLTTKDTVYT